MFIQHETQRRRLGFSSMTWCSSLLRFTFVVPCGGWPLLLLDTQSPVLVVRDELPSPRPL